MLAAHWWFWALVVAGLLPLATLSRRWDEIVVRVRGWAVARGLVSLPPGQKLSGRAQARDPSWLAVPIALWVAAGPWIWGYDDSAGAVACALASGGAVLVLAVGGIVFPALWALELLASAWLLVAPWLVGYGDDNGPVGLSDTTCGVLLAIVSIGALSAAERRLRPGAGGIGRLPPRS
jgi:SPW repeat